MTRVDEDEEGIEFGTAGLGEARLRPGKSGPGAALLGRARPGVARQGCTNSTRRGMAGHGSARLGAV